ncbi:MAG: DUF697 domain-containing protein [Acidobacteriota bacterium]|jgi:hypothetical protein
MRRTLIKLAAIAAALATVSFAVIVVNQSAQLVELASRAHPLAGQVLFWFLVVFYAACVLVPLLLWLRLPRSLAPPALAEGPELERYLGSLRSRLQRNPRLVGTALATREDIEAALGTLDAAADEVTKKAASRVFLTTALSQNGSLDSLFVLGLQTRLVWDIAHVYRQRPSLRDMGWLYTNVLATAFVAGELDDLDLSQQIQPVVQNALGAAAGALPGLQVASSVVASSIVSGTANAFLTLRVGVVTRRYCGALARPDKRSLRRSAFAEAAGMLGSIATAGTKKVVAAIAKASGRTVANTMTGVGGAVLSGAGAVGSKVKNGAGSMGGKVKSGAGSVGSAVKSGAGAVASTLSFRRKKRDS